MKKQVLTEYSGFANTVADTFRAAFRTAKVGDYAVEMTAPEGSTHGGLHALQHVTLRPETGMKLVAGTVHIGDKRAELRSFHNVNSVNEKRFGQPVSFDESAYKAFLEKAEGVLVAFGIEVTVTDTPVEPPPVAREEPPPDEPRSPRGLMIAGIVAGVVLVALALLIALR